MDFVELEMRSPFIVAAAVGITVYYLNINI
jgi:hypothetical protein